METNQIQEDEIEIDLKELFFLLLHKAWIILLALIVCAGVAGVWTKTMITPLYQSSSTLYILGQSTSITSLADIQLGSQLTKDYQIMANSRPVLDQVIENLGLNLTYAEMLAKVDISNPADTHFITITVTDPSPEMAKVMADEIAEVTSEQIATVMKTEAPSIAEKGYVPEFQSSPSTVKNCLLAGIIGAVIAIAVIIVIYLFNDTIKSSEDIERYLGLTTLGVIPAENKKKKQKKSLLHR